MNLPVIGTKIWANVVRPGYIVQTDDGCELPVNRVTEGYNTIILDDGNCRALEIDYAALVEVLGYFNPDPPAELCDYRSHWLNVW